jgi:hypothetical protein
MNVPMSQPSGHEIDCPAGKGHGSMYDCQCKWIRVGMAHDAKAIKAAYDEGYMEGKLDQPHSDDASAAYLLGQKHGRKLAATVLWRYFKDSCGPITGKGMTAGPVCVDEAVALLEGLTP